MSVVKINVCKVFEDVKHSINATCYCIILIIVVRVREDELEFFSIKRIK